MATVNLTAQRLRELVNYDPESGLMTRLVRSANIKSGAAVGCVRSDNGYLVARIDGALYRVHRLVWLYVHGDWPSGVIDHINGDRRDNRIQNLRDTSQQTNVHNSRYQARKSATGLQGVYKYGASKFRAQITVNRRFIHLGCFPTAELAHEAYKDAKKRLHFS